MPGGLEGLAGWAAGADGVGKVEVRLRGGAGDALMLVVVGLVEWAIPEVGVLAVL